MPSNPLVTLQELVENGHLDSVPEDFLVSENDRVKFDVTFDAIDLVELPVIDMHGVEEDVERRGLVVEQIRRACEQWGFFQVKNHGMPFSLMTRTQQVIREFFELPYEERKEIRAEVGEDAQRDEGYLDRFGDKGGKRANWSDLLRLYTFPVSGRRYELWPSHPPSFRKTIEDYCEEIEKVIRLISELISEGLGLETSSLNDYFAGKSEQMLQVNYYPPCPQPDVTIGLRKHSDSNLITLLLQDAIGLQVKKGEEWITVKPVEGWFVVNVGDQIEILSNGRYKSVEHRAFVSSKPRISIATFNAPSDETVVGPIRELLTAKERPRFKPIKFSEFKESFFYAGQANASSGKRHLGHLLVDQD